MEKINQPSISSQKIFFCNSYLTRTLLVISVFGLLVFLSNCMHYYKVREAEDFSNPDTQAELDLREKYVILRSEGAARNFYDIEIIGDTMTGQLRNLSVGHLNNLHPKRKGGNRYNIKVDRDVVSEVHIHIDNFGDLTASNFAAFPVSSIQKVQIYKKDGGATAASWILPPVLTIGTIAGIAAASSCPFVYVHDGANYCFAGEIYGGATYSSLERHDYMKLPDFKPNDRIYQLKIANELKEVQYTNFCELLMIEHSNKVNVLIDKYGNIQSYTTPQMPKRAVTTNGADITFSLLEKADNMIFAFDDEGGDNHVNGVIMTFNNDQNVKTGKLLIRAKNSTWADYAYGRFCNLFGTYYEVWNNDQKKLTSKKMKKNVMKQDIPLSVFIGTDKGWKFLDYYETVGPIAYREMVIPVDLSRSKSNIVRIKLETGYKFWELDYAAMDFTENIDVKYSKLQLIEGTDENEKDVKPFISNDDKQYLIQPDVGNEAILQYAIPNNTSWGNENVDISIFFHSKGYYERIRKYDNNPDWISLISHKHKHAFSKYSYNEYKKAREIKLLAEQVN